MIKINLIPVKRKKKPIPVPTFLIASAFVTLGALIGCLYVSYFFGSKLKDFENQKAAKAQEIKQLDEKIKEVQDFEAIKNKFNERKNIIEQLIKSQGVPVRILDEMSRRLTDGVWLTAMNISGASINIEGVGFSNPDIVTFVESLKGSELFGEVNLQGTQKSSMENVEVYTFRIMMQARV